MKIRIRGNSIRYRLTRPEVETFCKTGYFEDSTDFGNKKFTYALQAKEGIEMLDASFEENKIILYLDKQKSKDWFMSKKVGFSHIVTIDNGKELSLLLEKDFVCMDETVEDQSNNYPNPKM